MEYKTNYFYPSHKKIFNNTRVVLHSLKNRAKVIEYLYKSLGILVITVQAVELTFQGVIEFIDQLSINKDRIEDEINKMSDNEMDAKIDNSSVNKSKGRLHRQFERVKKLTHIDDSIESDFQASKDKRNTYIHSFFVENQIKDMTINEIKNAIIDMTYHTIVLKQISVDVGKQVHKEYVLDSGTLSKVYDKIQAKHKLPDDYQF